MDTLPFAVEISVVESDQVDSIHLMSLGAVPSLRHGAFALVSAVSSNNCVEIQVDHIEATLNGKE